MNLTDHVTRYSFDGNTTTPQDRSWDPWLRIHIERLHDGWFITQLASVYNHATGEWDHEYTFRHCDDRKPYLTDLTRAVETTRKLITERGGVP